MSPVECHTKAGLPELLTATETTMSKDSSVCRSQERGFQAEGARQVGRASSLSANDGKNRRHLGKERVVQGSSISGHERTQKGEGSARQGRYEFLLSV